MGRGMARELRALLQHLRRIVGPRAGGLADAHLLDRFVNGRDEAAFEVLVWRHGPMVLSVCRRVLRHEQDAEDAFQATFLTLVRKGHSIGKRQAVASWLYKVAYRIALEANMLASRRKLREKQDAGTLEAKATPQATDTAGWRELRAVLDEEVNRLPEKYRTPLILCYFEGKTYEEAAQELGCPKGTVSIRLMRARELLRPRLERRGLALSAGMLAALLSENATAAAVSKSLVEGIVKAALLFAAGKTTAGVLSGPAVALAEGALKSMLMTKLKVAAAILLVVGLAGSGAGVLTYDGVTGEQSKLQAEKLSTPAENEPQQQRSEAPSPPAGSKEDKTKLKPAASDRKLNALQEAYTQFSDLEQEYRRQESHWLDERLNTRLRLMEKEDQLKWIERTHAAARELNYAQLKRWAEQHGVGTARKQLQAEEEEYKAWEQARPDQLGRARKEFLAAEEENKAVERFQAFQRDRLIRRMETANERVMRLEEESRSGEPAMRAPSELEAKLDRLFREIADLRREIRRQQTDKGPNPPPERRPDQP